MKLNYMKKLTLYPSPPYNFDANFHKPSYFPSSDVHWEPGEFWTTMVWNGRRLGLKFENAGTVENPKIKLTVYSSQKLGTRFLESLISEIRWRFNFDQEISEFINEFKDDEFLGRLIKKWKGMKPIAGHSLYENLMIYIVLQNATVRRSVQMLENLFQQYGEILEFGGKKLSSFWKPEDLAKAREADLRALKVGYRVKFFIRISQQFAKGEINEFELRKKSKNEIKKEMLRLYGIGPASVEYLLFENFYFLDALERIPPWEQKIMSRLIFGKDLVPAERILEFFKQYHPYEKLAFHYVWEDLFWRRKNERIEWLEREIRL